MPWICKWFTRDPDARHARGNRQAAAMLRLPESANLSLTAPEAERPRHYRVFRNGEEAAPETLALQRAARGVAAQISGTVDLSGVLPAGIALEGTFGLSVNQTSVT